MTPQASAERIPLPDDYGFGVGFRIHINPDLALGPEPTNRFYFQEALEQTGLPIHLNERSAPGKWYGSTMWFYKNGERPTDGLVSINSPNYPQPFLSGEEGLRQMHQLENEALIPFNNVFSNSQQRQLSLSIPLTRGNTFSEAKEIISSYARNREHFPFRQSKMIKYAPFGSILERFRPEHAWNKEAQSDDLFLTIATSDSIQDSRWAALGNLTENIERLVRFAYAAKEGRSKEEIDEMLTMPVVPIAPKTELILSADQVRRSLSSEARTSGGAGNPNQKRQQRDVLTL